MYRWHLAIRTIPPFVLLMISLALTACAPQAAVPPTATMAATMATATMEATAVAPAEPISTTTQSQPTLTVPVAYPTSRTLSSIDKILATFSAQATVHAAATQSRASLQGVTACIPPQEPQQATVTRIVDGDTIHVSINGRDYTVRYIGMNTPEDTTKVEPFGPEATEANRALVAGKTVLLYKDVSETDRYGRLLRFVVIPGDPPVFVNYELVRRGFANTSTYPPDVACAQTYLAAEAQARQEGVGLWGALTAPTTASVRPTAAPAQPTVQPPSRGNCDPSYPDVCIAPPPPDLDCGDIPYRRFRVLPPDPHRFDGDHDGIGCES